MSIAGQIPKKAHGAVLRKLLSGFPTEELENLIDVIREEQRRRADAKK